MRLASQILVSIFLAVSFVGCAKHNLKKQIAMAYRTGSTIEEICSQEETAKDWGGFEQCVREAEFQRERMAKAKREGREITFGKVMGGFADGMKNSESKSFGEAYLENTKNDPPPQTYRPTRCTTKRGFIRGEIITECQ